MYLPLPLISVKLPILVGGIGCSKFHGKIIKIKFLKTIDSDEKSDNLLQYIKPKERKRGKC